METAPIASRRINLCAFTASVQDPVRLQKTDYSATIDAFPKTNPCLTHIPELPDANTQSMLDENDNMEGKMGLHSTDKKRYALILFFAK